MLFSQAFDVRAFVRQPVLSSLAGTCVGILGERHAVSRGGAQRIVHLAAGRPLFLVNIDLYATSIVFHTRIASMVMVGNNFFFFQVCSLVMLCF